MKRTALLTLLLLPACSANVKTWEVKQSIKTAGLKQLQLKVENGNIELIPHGEPMLAIQARFELQTKSAQALKAIAGQIHLQVLEGKELTRIRIAQPAKEQGYFVLATHLQLKVPTSPGLHLDCETTNGHIKTPPGNRLELNGNLRMITSNGDIDLRGINGQAHTFRTVNGDIKLLDFNGAIQADTANGHITVGLESMNRPESYRFNTANGSVDLKLPSQASARIQYSKGTGELKTNLTTRDGHLLIGQGAAQVQVSTVNGDIHVFK